MDEMMNKSRNPKWSHDDTMIAFYVFCNIPFKDSSSHHPLVVEYSKLLPGRTSAALNMKIGNLGRLDPNLRKQGITGLTHGAKMEEDIWAEFEDDSEAFIQKCNEIIAKRKIDIGISTEESMVYDKEYANKIGDERVAMVKQRVNQTFFRNAVLSSYSNKCCITGMSQPQLLEAAHIVSWASDKNNRINPSNGLCMNVLMHRAYDRMLLSVSPDYTIGISEQLLDDEISNKRQIEFFQKVNGQQIIKPTRFLPNRDFLAQHYEKFINSGQALSSRHTK